MSREAPAEHSSRPDSVSAAGNDPEFAVVLHTVRGDCRVEVTGDLDLVGAAVLRAVLEAAAGHSGQVSLDLGGVTSFSCAAVTALLAGRRAAADRLVMITAAAPVILVLELLGLRALFLMVPAAEHPRGLTLPASTSERR
jgi:anti-anti-sigma factor